MNKDKDMNCMDHNIEEGVMPNKKRAFFVLIIQHLFSSLPPARNVSLCCYCFYQPHSSG